MSRSIAEIFIHYKIKEVHVSLGHGVWRYENWGYPVIEAPPGAEVWAWFDGSLNETEVDKEWKVQIFISFNQPDKPDSDKTDKRLPCILDSKN